MKKFLLFVMVVIAIVMTSCSGCKKQEPVNPEPVAPVEFVSYNVDSVMIADYDLMAGSYQDFHYYETDILLDTTFDEGGTNVIYMRNIFQAGDSCYMFFHSEGVDSIVVLEGWWLECMDMVARNKIGWNDMLAIVEPYRCELPTRAVTFRRPLAPPFPKNGQWIIGVGLLFIDGETGEIWNDTTDNE